MARREQKGMSNQGTRESSVPPFVLSASISPLSAIQEEEVDSPPTYWILPEGTIHYLSRSLFLLLLCLRSNEGISIGLSSTSPSRLRAPLLPCGSGLTSFLDEEAVIPTIPFVELSLSLPYLTALLARYLEAVYREDWSGSLRQHSLQSNRSLKYERRIDGSNIVNNQPTYPAVVEPLIPLSGSPLTFSS